MAENPNTRLEAFSDGVFAIALTLLVLDIKVPASEAIHGSSDTWLALRHLLPSILTFLWSFIVILITWVNHHNFVKLIGRSSAHFIYANGFLLLIVVFVPFPTALLGDSLLTDHAGPAVMLYNAIFAIQALSWNLMGRAVLRPRPLTKNGKASTFAGSVIRQSYYAMVLYSLFAIAGLWFPLTVSIASGATWIFWLIYGISFEEDHSLQAE